MRRIVLILSLTLLPTGCAVTQDRPARPTADQAKRQGYLEDKRADAKTGNYLSVQQYVIRLIEAQGKDDVAAAYGDVDWAKLNSEAEAMLDELASSDDVEIHQNVAGLKAMLLVATGREDEGIALFRGVHEAAPNFHTAMGVMIIHTDNGIPMTDAPDFCAANRSLAVGDGQTYQYMQACAKLNPSDDLATSLPWATPADLEFYANADAEVQAKQEARLESQRRADEEQAMTPSSDDSSSDGSSGSSGAAAPNSVSITLRNTCRSSVDVFFGDKPKFGSGTYSNLSPNTSTSKSLRPGDMIWIVDDSQNGVSSITVSASTRTVEVTSGCTGLTSN